MESFNQSVINHKRGLLNLAAELGNVSKACGIVSFSVYVGTIKRVGRIYQ